MTERLSGDRAFALPTGGAHAGIGRLGPADMDADRERPTDVASPGPVTRPRSVAVIGASRRAGTVGAELLRHLIASGFKGAVHAVNPHCAGDDLHGAPCVATLADLPEVPDLAVIAVPAYAVPGVAAACGRSGIPALMVVGSGLTADRRRALLAACREHGMRLVEPNRLGIAGTGI
ncbi:CoA binding domain-containing protein [Actinomadura meyerae]|jgi:acyl-CoA synthetase (NDP forming)|uniref:CoA binding domain-containing protein n=1 Tax=Actinomadura meyerae TaxID=240840 RepID=A0A239P1T1_9ACTN|nr:CoA-binding protein [Actinomadura meyerae]SNT61087.1 CoA binding domain-containing protein [Actinomadura meyerae]